MAWNDQTDPNTGYGAPVQPSAGMPRDVMPQLAGQPAASPVGPLAAQQPGFPASPIQPAQGQVAAAQFDRSGQQPQPAVQFTPPQPAPARMPAAESEQPDANDDIWIQRTKRAIAETQNDPYRQVQLVQHLSVLYLKERFGREVQPDKG